LYREDKKPYHFQPSGTLEDTKNILKELDDHFNNLEPLDEEQRSIS